MKAWLSHFAQVLLTYGPWGIFVLGAVDSVGVPLPAALDAMLIYIGAGSAHDPQRAYFAAAMAVLGSLAGNAILFVAARRGAKWMRRKDPPPGKRRRFHEWFDRYGLLTVFIPAVTPVAPFPLKFFVISAAAVRTPLSKLLLVILAGRAIRFFGLVILGLYFGQDAYGFLTHHMWALVGAALAVTLTAALLIRLTAGRRQPTL